MDRQVLMERMRTTLTPALVWYRERDAREQAVLRLLAATLVVAVFWFALLSPLLSGRDQARQQWISAEQTRQWIEDNREAVMAARQQSGAGSAGGDWIANLNARAAEYQVTLKGYTPEGEDSVRVLLEEQPFSNVMAWLQALERGAGVSPASIEISEGSREGTVNVRATLERGV